jgi:hypothetical protein
MPRDLSVASGRGSPFHSFTNCPSLQVQIQKEKPNEGTSLKVLGYLAGSGAMTSREAVKQFARPETLEYLLKEPVLSEQRKFKIPDVKLEIYFVQGGLLPGYSGGPVFNDRTKELVGIVNGGLDKGQDDYNWVIPATKLGALFDSVVKTMPPQLAMGAPAHFSSAIVAVPAGQPQPSGPQRRTALNFNQNGWRYQYVLTKTRSLADLARTSDDPGGVRRLLQIYGPVVGTDAETRLRFDIYQEVDRGLIIAVPAGQKLQFGSPQPGYTMRKSNANNGADYAQFEELRHTDDKGRPLPDEYGVLEASDGTGTVKASDPRFFNEMVAKLLAECKRPGQSTCTLDPASLRNIDFGNGNKILKVGFRVNDGDYDYYTFAVQGKRVFRAYAQIFDDGKGLIQCKASPSAAGCAQSNLALTQLSQLAAVHLTTFAGLGSQTAKTTLETQFKYDSRLDNPATLHVGYYVGKDLRFYNGRGKVWEESGTRNYHQILTEQGRDTTHVYLQSGNSSEWFKVPINGGPYAISTDGRKTWRQAGVLNRNPSR